jgi:hypothetical protein
MALKAASRSGAGPRSFSTWGDARQLRDHFAQQFKLAPGLVRIVAGDAGRIPARALQGCGKADRHGIGHDGENDGYRLGGPDRRAGRRPAEGGNHAGIQRNQFRRQRRQAVELAFRVAAFEDEVLALGVAEFR